MIVGIDEVGRGPLAGPVTICALVFRKPLPKGVLKGIRNSKALSKQARVVWYKKALALRRAGYIDFVSSSSAATLIDRRGISAALHGCIKRALARLKVSPLRSKVFLDGSLYAPAEYTFQKTIIKGDEKIPVIALASIVAKVRRDAYMYRQAKVFPGYGFEAHVGYGTSAHYQAIKRFGVSPLHRRSFLSGIVKEKRAHA